MCYRWSGGLLIVSIHIITLICKQGNRLVGLHRETSSPYIRIPHQMTPLAILPSMFLLFIYSSSLTNEDPSSLCPMSPPKPPSPLLPSLPPSLVLSYRTLNYVYRHRIPSMFTFRRGSSCWYLQCYRFLKTMPWNRSTIINTQVVCVLQYFGGISSQAAPPILKWFVFWHRQEKSVASNLSALT